MWVRVGPGLAALAVREVSIDSTDCDVQDNKELAVEWSNVVLTLPWVVAALFSESALLPEGLL